MAKVALKYVCQSCGSSYGRWQGKCEDCGGWNTLVEERSVAAPLGGKRAPSGKTAAMTLESLDGESAPLVRALSNIHELDRVTGGGFVPGSVLLIGGDPGIGKSTLLLQCAAAMSSQSRRVVYVSGEEAMAQVRMRAKRLGVEASRVELAAETHVEGIVASLSVGEPPALVIIDSIQTMWSEQIDSAPGTVGQVRAAAQVLIRYAKGQNVCVILVGHVTKDGQIAGPRVVEHMVDVVLSFEGEGQNRFRVLRGLKNRFGPTDEIGVFEMAGTGLREVPNPSSLFLNSRDTHGPGCVVYCGIEGTRPILVEIEALVAPTSFGTPRRASVGWDNGRLAQLIAVLEARCGVRLAGYDVYLNVAGGIRLSEPAADLAVAAALVSSLSGRPCPKGAVFFGEVALSGSLRPVAQVAARLKEATKLGFECAFIPSSDETDTALEGDFKVIGLESLQRLVDLL